MSTQKRKIETRDKNLKKPKTDLVTCPESNKSEILTRTYVSAQCKDIYCEESVTAYNGDQSNEDNFLLIGEHENQISEGGEAELYKYKKNCKKNPGHPEFIPIESFSLEHLPEGHRDVDVYEYIKAVADLTVKISVYITSPERPAFWPNTRIPYFLSEIRGKRALRTGSGRVRDVKRFTDMESHWKYGCTTCPCDKCKVSDKPSQVWWQVDLRTAAHVIVDSIEASHTTVRLFYDREDGEVVILSDNVCVEYVDVETDKSVLYCVTCDEQLGNRLEELWERYVNVRRKVYQKYTDSWGTDTFNFIVSHPHGCNKQVSVGQWKDMLQVRDGEVDYKFTYTTCTCPGSSGAGVNSVGYDWLFDHVHSGSLKSGLNCSSVW